MKGLRQVTHSEAAEEGCLIRALFMKGLRRVTLRYKAEHAAFDKSPVYEGIKTQLAED